MPRLASGYSRVICGLCGLLPLPGVPLCSKVPRGVVRHTNRRPKDPARFGVVGREGGPGDGLLPMRGRVRPGVAECRPSTDADRNVDVGLPRSGVCLPRSCLPRSGPGDMGRPRGIADGARLGVAGLE